MPRPGFVCSPRGISTNGLQGVAAGARTCPATRGQRPVHALRMLTAGAIADKSYQLEELEDEATATSALYLRRDGSIAYGRTDGPEPATVRGVWVYDESEKELRMEIERNYVENGFSFGVRRVFKGHLDCKRDLDIAVFSGNIFGDESDFDDARSALGHWSMIVATDDLPSEDYDATQQ